MIGNVADAGPNRYAMLEGGPSQAVYVVPETLFKDNDKPALDLLDKQVLTLDAVRVNKVQLTSAKPEDAIALTKDEKGVWKAEGSTFGVDKPSADALFLAVTRPVITRFSGYGVGVKWADYGLEKPESTVTVTG